MDRLRVMLKGLSPRTRSADNLSTTTFSCLACFRFRLALPSSAHSCGGGSCNKTKCSFHVRNVLFRIKVQGARIVPGILAESKDFRIGLQRDASSFFGFTFLLPPPLTLSRRVPTHSAAKASLFCLEVLARAPFRGSPDLRRWEWGVEEEERKGKGKKKKVFFTVAEMQKL